MLCKKNEIAPISHVDKSKISQYVEEYFEEKIDGFFIWPSYERDEPYKIQTDKRSTIIVSDSVGSKIHIGNIVDLLTNGILQPTPYNPMSEKTVKVNIGGDFYIRSDITKFTVHDFESVKAVFIESMATSNISFNQLPANCMIFSLSDEKTKSFKILLKNGRVRNYQEILSLLRKQK